MLSTEDTSNSEETTGSLYIKGLQNEIRKIDSKCSRILSEHNSSTSKTERRTLKNEYEALQVERAKLVNDLQSYK